jgi:RNA-directed DNA polymerase
MRASTSTRRAQDRESVSQALERLRQAARQGRKEKFTTLFPHLTIDLLEAAFAERDEDAAAGADGLTWKESEANLGRNLEDLHARLHRGA